MFTHLYILCSPLFVKITLDKCVVTVLLHAVLIIARKSASNRRSSSSSSSSSDCCAGQRSTPHSRTLEVRPGRITKKLGLRYDCDCERDETKSLLGVLMLGCDILIANDE